MEQNKKQQRNKVREVKSVYSPCQITKRVLLPVTAVGENIMQTLERTVSSMVSGLCIVEGYVKPGTVKIITHSSGIVVSSNIIFDVVFNCEVCFPVAGMNVNCIAKNITKAGIEAESIDDKPSPFILYVLRDHYYASDYFNSIKENDKFIARVVAQRFELNDKYVTIIAELVPQRDTQPTKPRLILEG